MPTIRLSFLAAAALTLALTACDPPASTPAASSGEATQPATAPQQPGNPLILPGNPNQGGGGATSPRPSASATAGAATGSPAPGASASPTPAGTPTPDPRLPRQAPYIVGEIVSYSQAPGGSLYLATFTAIDAAGTNQANVTVLTSTAIWRQEGTGMVRLGASDLRAGQQVKVWTVGPVRESFPVQFEAQAVLITPEAAVDGE